MPGYVFANARFVALFSVLVMFSLPLGFGSAAVREATTGEATTGTAPAAAAKVSAPVPRPDYCGVWGIWGGEKVGTEGRPWFKGVVVTTNWDQIEPENGKFAWDALDEKVRLVAGKGLYMMLMVYHGHKCPKWAYEAGVPKVVTKSDQESRVIHPYYLDPHYKPLLTRMIQETARHVAAYPPEIRGRVIGVQCPTGKSGDPQPYQAEPVEERYRINQHGKEWVEWTICMIQVYRDAYKDFKPPFFMLFKGPNPDTNDWLVKNIPDSWRKPHAIAQGYQFNGEIQIMNELYPLTRRPKDGVLIRTRGELDNTEGKGKNWFTAAPVWNVYWAGLWNLTYGTDIWNQLNGVLEDERHAPALAFVSKYAGYKDAADSPGAWVALRDGLDCMDVKRFPEDRFGPVGPHGEDRPSDNKDRYRKIAEAFAQYGAALDDLDHVSANGLNVRKEMKGINDVAANIWTANYGMFLEQLDPDETSQGYWRAGSKDERYGRFARGFDSKNGKTAMRFRLDDHFFAQPGQPQSVTVRVVYFDRGHGAWALAYAGANGKAEALRVTCEDSGHWREKTVELKDARFDHRLSKDADLALEWLNGDDTIFHILEINRLARP